MNKPKTIARPPRNTPAIVNAAAENNKRKVLCAQLLRTSAQYAEKNTEKIADFRLDRKWTSKYNKKTCRLPVLRRESAGHMSTAGGGKTRAVFPPAVEQKRRSLRRRKNIRES